MKDVTELKGLSDLRTATTTHIRSKPPQEGTEYLELYLASNEKKRLAKLVQTWEKQKDRAQERHVAVSESIANVEHKLGGLEQTAEGSDSLSKPGADGTKAAPDYTRQQWNTMSLDY